MCSEIKSMFLVSGGPVGVKCMLYKSSKEMVCPLSLRRCKADDFLITNVLLSDNLTYS